MVAIHNYNDDNARDNGNDGRSPGRAGHLLREVARMYSRAQRVVADSCRTTSTQCHLLGELARSGPLPLSELGMRVCLEKSWVSRAVDAMVERGVVSKQVNPADARSWLVTLTGEGMRTVKELDRTLDAHAAQLLACLSPRERAAVERSLALLVKALQADTAAQCCLPSTAPGASKAGWPRSTQ